MTHTKLPEQDFELAAGDDKNLHFTTRDENDKLIDITGATLKFGMATHPGAKTNQFSYTSPTNITITDGPNGKFTVAIQSADTLLLPARKTGYHYDVLMTSAAGKRSTVAHGMVDLIPEVSGA